MDMKYGQTDLNWGENYIFCRESFKAELIIQSNSVCPFDCSIHIVPAHDNMQEALCMFSCAHIGTQLIFACNCTHWNALLCICVLLWEHKSPVHMPIVVELSIEPQSRQNSFSRLSCTSLCLFSRWSEQSLVQSHVDKKKSVRQILWTHSFTKDSFMESHERRRYYVEILYTSVSRLCPRRQFVSWNF